MLRLVAFYYRTIRPRDHDVWTSQPDPYVGVPNRLLHRNSRRGPSHHRYGFPSDLLEDEGPIILPTSRISSRVQDPTAVFVAGQAVIEPATTGDHPLR